MTEIAVIGAGPGGLSAAMLLNSRGFEVTIFEARDQGSRAFPLAYHKKTEATSRPQGSGRPYRI